MKLTKTVLLFAAALIIAVCTKQPVSAQAEELVPMYRLYFPGTHEHLYTKDINERNTLAKTAGWKYEGIGWYAPTEGTPVYRLYHPGTTDHHYTMDKHEYQVLGERGWNQEGICWYSDDQKTIPVYRDFCPSLITGAHHFTTDLNEHKTITKSGSWKDEGIAWYAAAAGKADYLPIFNGIDYSEIFNADDYMAMNPDISWMFENPDQALQHFARYGIVEGRTAKAEFSQETYDYIRHLTHPYPEVDGQLDQLNWDLRAAFEYAANIPYKNPPELDANNSPWRHSSMWYYQYGQSHGYGNCYVKAATFTILARELGYQVRHIGGFVPTRSAPDGAAHSWVEIWYDGAWRVCDASYYQSTGIGWMIEYGQRGTYRYMVEKGHDVPDR